jgi:hypothetical protein
MKSGDLALSLPIHSLDSFLESIDFKLLAVQKEALGQLQAQLDGGDDEEWWDALEGVLNFFDSLEALNEQRRRP